MYKIKSFVGIKYCVAHNTGGLLYNHDASTQHHDASIVNAWHKTLYPGFISELGWHGLYNFYIDADGKITQFRKVGEPTGAQRGHNNDSVSICLAGNFSKKSPDRPTEAQIKSQEKIIDWLISSGIKIQNIVPHRFLGATECYGSALPDNWARNIGQKIVLTRLMKFYIALLDLIRKQKGILGGWKIKLGGPAYNFKYVEDMFTGPDNDQSN